MPQSGEINKGPPPFIIVFTWKVLEVRMVLLLKGWIVCFWWCRKSSLIGQAVMIVMSVIDRVQPASSSSSNGCGEERTAFHTRQFRLDEMLPKTWCRFCDGYSCLFTWCDQFFFVWVNKKHKSWNTWFAVWQYWPCKLKKWLWVDGLCKKALRWSVLFLFDTIAFVRSAKLACIDLESQQKQKRKTALLVRWDFFIHNPYINGS